MTRAVSDVLDRIAPRACIEAFGAYRVPLREQPRPALGAAEIPAMDAAGSGALVAGVVGFTGGQLRGAVLLATTFEVIALARPPGLVERTLSTDSWSDWVMVRDWAAELSNQILGRIKNRLRAFNVEVEVSTPTAFSGRAIAFARPKAAALRPFLFDAPAGQVWLSLDTVSDPRLALEPGGDPGAKEGDIILF